MNVERKFIIISVVAIAVFISLGFIYLKSNDIGNVLNFSGDTVAVPQQLLPESLLDTTLADGFDFPVGNKDGKGSYTTSDNKTYNGWYIATRFAENYSLGIHPGEDWNGSGGGNTDLGQPVYATAAGEVIFAGECASPWGNVILLKHRFHENGKIVTVFSQYAHLKDMHVKKGQMVKRRQKIASIGRGNHNEYPAHLHFEIRREAMAAYAVDYWPSSHKKSTDWVKEHYDDPSAFIMSRRKLTVPAKEKKLAIAVKHKHQLFYYEKGKLKKTYEMAWGQSATGHKQHQGDNRTPEGAYTVLDKAKGPFDASGSNWAQAYLGTRWIRLNYPNCYDATAGLHKGLITQAQHDAICKAVKEGKMPPKNTKLGGGIGIHGWKTPDWKVEDRNRALTWGCISLRKANLEELYELVEWGTPVIIVS